MNYSQIFYNDIANGPGFRTSLFVSGCTHHCKGCFNSETWDFKYGKPFTKEVEDHIINSILPPYIDGITILGGEPLEYSNAIALVPLIIRAYYLRKSIWIYSGYTFDELYLNKKRYQEESYAHKMHYSDTIAYILEHSHVLVDGEFKEDLKDISLKFRGSSNQRIIDLQKSIDKNDIVLYNV